MQCREISDFWRRARSGPKGNVPGMSATVDPRRSDGLSSGGLEIKNVAKRYGDVHAINGLSLDVPRGSLVGFLGPNGAGKTTTMRSIVGMVKLDQGSVCWDGDPIDDASRARIGYMPQERGLYPRMKVREQVIYFGRLAGLTKADAATKADYWIDRVELTDRADSLVQDLSGGNQQRVQLAVSLVHDPDLLVLDEPFAGLDPVAAETMRDIIDERASAGASVLFSTHQLNMVEGLCEEVVIIARGKLLAAGRVSDLRLASKVRELRVQWVEEVASDWTPLLGELEEFDRTQAFVRLPAEVDMGASIANVLAAGPVRQLTLEPPGLDDLFAELVSGAVIPNFEQGNFEQDGGQA